MIHSGISTSRLALEPISCGHAGPLFDALRDRRVYEHIPLEPPASIADLAARYSFLESGGSPPPHEVWVNFAVRILPDGPYIGRVEATVGPASADVAYLLDPRHWGQGYGAEMVAALLDHLFLEYDVEVVRGTLDTRNRRSAALLMRLGFVCVDHVRNADSFKGSSSHEYVFELRRNSWNAGAAGKAPEPVPKSLTPILTPRLVLRCWTPGDAPLLKEAIDASLPELKRWMPWAAAEPLPVAAKVERIGKMQRAFAAGEDWTYGIFDRNESRVVGGSGLHPRVAPDRLEIGYWIRSSEVGQGLATEVAAALADVAFRLHGASAVEIHCDPGNARSAGVPRRLGFEHVETRVADRPAPVGGTGDRMVWVLQAPGSR